MATPAGVWPLAFARRASSRVPAVIPYVMAGFPRLGDTAGLLAAAQRAGCLAAEVGVPFSDPIADGPTIQATGSAALANGMTPALALEQIAEARREGVTIPLAVMIYVNLVMSWGWDDFSHTVRRAGAEAIIVPDLPVGESAPLRAAAAAEGLALIPMVAPTTPIDRIRAVCEGASGFVYCVSRTGTTGARSVLSEDAVRLLDSVLRVTELPRALGFGIARPEHLTGVAGHAEAVVVGSALLDAVAHEPERPAEAAERFLRQLVTAPA